METDRQLCRTATHQDCEYRQVSATPTSRDEETPVQGPGEKQRQRMASPLISVLLASIAAERNDGDNAQSILEDHLLRVWDETVLTEFTSRDGGDERGTTAVRPDSVYSSYKYCLQSPQPAVCSKQPSFTAGPLGALSRCTALGYFAKRRCVAPQRAWFDGVSACLHSCSTNVRHQSAACCHFRHACTAANTQNNLQTYDTGSRRVLNDGCGCGVRSCPCCVIQVAVPTSCHTDNRSCTGSEGLTSLQSSSAATDVGEPALRNDFCPSTASSIDATLRTKRLLRLDHMTSSERLQAVCVEEIEASSAYRSQQATTVTYYMCEEPIPYRTTLIGRRPTLGQFKQLITKKKGTFRYFFRKACNEFDSGVVLEELTDDETELPLWDGKVIGKVERVQ